MPKPETKEREGSDDFGENSARSIYEKMQARAEGTNINPTTLLTTDYLNQFNGFLMLLEMLPTAPEDMAEELVSWEPVTYEDHFKSSGFRDKDLAIEAYAHVPEEFLEPFTETVDELNQFTIDLRERIKVAVDSSDVAQMEEISLVGVPQLKSLIEHAGSIVNGVVVSHHDASQSTIDAIFD